MKTYWWFNGNPLLAHPQSVTNSINRSSSRFGLSRVQSIWILPGFIFIPLLLACFGLSPLAQAVSPEPDGGYDGWNTAEGTHALRNLNVSTGIYNTALGGQALFRNTDGGYNTAVGFDALFHNTSNYNTATGAFALFSTTTGTLNTATGVNALRSNTTGHYNTANGINTLYHNTTGSENTADGAGALFTNTTGGANTALGRQALFTNSIGNSNTANGYQALFGNTTGSFNAAVGNFALLHNSTGYDNTGIGSEALWSNTTGLDNTAIGEEAGYYITGSGNVAIGEAVLGTGGVNNTTWIRNVYASVASGRAVYVNADNKIGTLSSSQRYKDEIRPMAKASEAILSLRPVSFRYGKEVDPTRTLSFGLIAEEVAKVDPDLVTRDRGGKPETVRYEAVNAMLLNEFLKEHRAFLKEQRKVDNQEATITQLKSTIARQEKKFAATAARQEAQIEALTLGLQKVSAQITTSRPEPQMVLNNQ